MDYGARSISDTHEQSFSVATVRYLGRMLHVASMGLGALASFGHYAFSQEVISIPHRPSCGGCAIQVTRVASVGSPADAESPDIRTLQRDSRGRLFAIAESRFSVLVYDSLGKYQASFGGRGQGPGEFSRLLTDLLVTRGDSIWVVDDRGRMSFFTPSFRFVRHAKSSISNVGKNAILVDGRIITSVDLRSPSRIGYPFHVMEKDSLVRSMGTEQSVVARSAPLKLPSGIVADMSQAALWFSSDSSYTFGSLDVNTGRQSTFVVVDAPWWFTAPLFQLSAAEKQAATDAIRARRPLPPPRTQPLRSSGITIVRADTSGLIWVRGGGPNPSDPSDGRKALSLVEVIDTRSGHVLVSQTVWPPFTFMDRSMLAYSGARDSLGTGSFSVWRVSLVRR